MKTNIQSTTTTTKPKHKPITTLLVIISALQMSPMKILPTTETANQAFEAHNQILGIRDALDNISFSTSELVQNNPVTIISE